MQERSVVIRTREAARKFLDDFDNSDKAHSCCYGHLDCSTRDGGPCYDETLSNFPELADE